MIESPCSLLTPATSRCVYSCDELEFPSYHTTSPPSLTHPSLFPLPPLHTLHSSPIPPSHIPHTSLTHPSNTLHSWSSSFITHTTPPFSLIINPHHQPSPTHHSLLLTYLPPSFHSPSPLHLPRTPSTLHRLEEEGNANQKLLSERANAENKIKTLEEQMTLSEDNIAKVRASMLVISGYTVYLVSNNLLCTRSSLLSHSLMHAELAVHPCSQPFVLVHAFLKCPSAHVAGNNKDKVVLDWEKMPWEERSRVLY